MDFVQGLLGARGMIPVRNPMSTLNVPLPSIILAVARTKGAPDEYPKLSATRFSPQHFRAPGQQCDVHLPLVAPRDEGRQSYYQRFIYTAARDCPMVASGLCPVLVPVFPGSHEEPTGVQEHGPEDNYQYHIDV